MRASVAARSLAGRRIATGRWLTTGAPAGPSFEYKMRSPDDADARPRKTCTVCGFINWFLEIGETGEEGAAREAREEINAEIDVGGLLAVYALPHIGQIQMIYSSVLKNAAGQGANGNLDKLRVSAGQETDEVMAVPWEDIPWDSLAFPTTSWALWHHRLRAETAAAAAPATTALNASVSAKPPSGATDGDGDGDGDVASGHEKGGGTTIGVGAGTEEGRVAAISGGGVPADAAGSTGGSGLGSGLRVSDGPVFSTPASSSSVFWSPGRGLHLKDGWNISTDS